jgi:hypothetical protein
MSAEDIAIAILLAALFAAMFAAMFDAAPVIAVWAVRRAAKWWHSDLDTPEELAQEWEALIKARPIGLLKLCTGLGLLGQATLRQGRFVLHQRAPATSIGRLLRVLAGVDEQLLDKVPFERARHTSIGGLVLGTALLSAVSMWFALRLVGVRQAWLVVGFAVVWSLVVMNMDRFLVASAYGLRIRSKTLVAVPRLLIALVFGIIIAEPLLLGVFASAIDQRTNEDRAATVATLESRLVQCNPAPPDAPPTATLPSYCADYLLALPQGSGKTYLDERNREIEKRVAVQRERMTSIGLLERDSTLSELAKASPTVLVATWALRLLVCLIDCLPVIATLLGGTSAYDRLVIERARGPA